MERTQHGHGPPVTPEYRTGHTPVKHEKDTVRSTDASDGKSAACGCTHTHAGLRCPRPNSTVGRAGYGLDNPHSRARGDGR